MTQTTAPTDLTQELTAGNVKAAMKDAGAKSSDLWKVERKFIRIIPGFNPRNPDDPEYIAHVRAIADSIKANGYYDDKPLAGYVTREGDANFINVTDGHSRLAAFDLAVSEGYEQQTLPIVVKPRGTSIEDLTVALVTSNSGKPFTPYETGLIVKRLAGFGMNDKVIAERLGITKRYLDDLLVLVAAPPSVRNLVAQGQVSASLAVEVVKEHGDKATEQLRTGLETAKEAGKTRVTKKHLSGGSKPFPAAASASAQAKEHARTASLTAGMWASTTPGARSGVLLAHPQLAEALNALSIAYGHKV